MRLFELTPDQWTDVIAGGILAALVLATGLTVAARKLFAAWREMAGELRSLQTDARQASTDAKKAASASKAIATDARRAADASETVDRSLHTNNGGTHVLDHMDEQAASQARLIRAVNDLRDQIEKDLGAVRKDVDEARKDIGGVRSEMRNLAETDRQDRDHAAEEHRRLHRRGEDVERRLATLERRSDG